MKAKYIIIIVLLAVIVFIAYKYRKQLAIKLGMNVPVTGGNTPTADDETCGSIETKTSGTGKIIEACTRPKYKKVTADTKEKAWTMETADYPFSQCLENSTMRTPDGTKWFFNYQSGAKCIYINNTGFPF